MDPLFPSSNGIYLFCGPECSVVVVSLYVHTRVCVCVCDSHIDDIFGCLDLYSVCPAVNSRPCGMNVCLYKVLIVQNKVSACTPKIILSTIFEHIRCLTLIEIISFWTTKV